MFVSQEQTNKQVTFEERTAAREANEARQARLQAEINAAQAELATLIAEHDREAYWSDHAGILTETGFQSYRHGHTPASARQLLEVGKAMEELPKVAASFKAGELSLHQVRILVDICEPATEDHLLATARGLSGAQLTRFASHYRAALRQQSDRSFEERHVSTGHRPDASWSINGAMSSHHGAIVDKALAKAIEELTADGAELDGCADDPWKARQADALVAIAESFLAHGLEHRAGPERFMVVIDIDLETLTNDSLDAVARLRDGGIISSRTAKTILDDCSIVEAITKDGDPLDLGRKHRFPNTPLRRALAKRDRCCRFPGCTRTIGLEADHSHDWGKGGRTRAEDLRRYCGVHHTLRHKGYFTVERSVDGTDIYRDRDGKVIEAPTLRSWGAGGIERLTRERNTVIDESTCLPQWHGEPGNLGYVADLALAHRVHQINQEERERNRHLSDEERDAILLESARELIAGEVETFQSSDRERPSTGTDPPSDDPDP